MWGDRHKKEPITSVQKLQEDVHKHLEKYVGQYFLKLLKPGDYKEFEQLTAEVFRLLGFRVDVRGHQARGEYPDGYLEGILAVIYDCKNQHNYHMTSDDRRATASYIDKHTTEIQEKYKDIKIYFAVIAHSFDKNIKDRLREVESVVKMQGFAITSRALLYLYSKMIETKLKGGDIYLSAVVRDFVTKQVVTPEVVDEVLEEDFEAS